MEDSDNEDELQNNTINVSGYDINCPAGDD
jgi:hypothetical protein